MFVFAMVLGDTIINKRLSIKYQHIFIKTYMSNKTLLVYSMIHFCYCQELNDKNK